MSEYIIIKFKLRDEKNNNKTSHHNQPVFTSLTIADLIC